MRIYYGYLPYVTLLDQIVMDQLSFHDSLESLMDKFIEHNIRTDNIYCTINPLLINCLEDDIAKEYVYYLFKDNKKQIEIKFGDDVSLCKKLAMMGPGEALADSEHVLILGEL